MDLALDQLRGIAGIAFRDEDGTLVQTHPRALIRPLDRIPWPQRQRRDLQAYLDTWRTRHGQTALSMVTSRGCPFHCTWCSKQVYGDTYRRRSVEDVLGELHDIKTRFDPDQVWFADDLFTINRRWVHRFGQQVRARGLQTPFYLVGRPGSFDPALCATLRQAGCFRVYLSAESGAQHVLDAMHKDGTVLQIRTAARLLHAHGIEVGVFVMVGYPGETPADVDATLAMLHDIRPEVVLLSMAHPMKGTAFYDEVADRIENPPGWEQTHGGRLAFHMDQPRRFYDLAIRWMLAETELTRQLRAGRIDVRALGLLGRSVAYRAGMQVARAGGGRGGRLGEAGARIAAGMLPRDAIR